MTQNSTIKLFDTFQRNLFESLLTKYLVPPPPLAKMWAHILGWGDRGGVSSSAHLSQITLQNINSGQDIHGSFSQH